MGHSSKPEGNTGSALVCHWEKEEKNCALSPKEKKSPSFRKHDVTYSDGHESPLNCSTDTSVLLLSLNLSLSSHNLRSVTHIRHMRNRMINTVWSKEKKGTGREEGSSEKDEIQHGEKGMKYLLK